MDYLKKLFHVLFFEHSKTSLSFIWAGLIFIGITNLHAQSDLIKIQGIVFDKKTGERITGALVIIPEIDTTISDENGLFELYSPIGNYFLTSKMLGYEPFKTEINVSGESTTIFIRLKPILIKLNQITIFGKQSVVDYVPNYYEIQYGDLRNIPQIGEKDIFRSLQTLPGVSTTSDFSSQLFLRGGNFDETLILLNDIPLFNPYHLGGIFGIINSDLVRKEKLYPSNYPVNYGGYLSGVLNISTKQGNFEKIKGILFLGLISSKIQLEAPVLGGSAIFSFRRTYADLIGKIIGQNLPYFFYDTYFNYTLPINKNNVIKFDGFYSVDRINVFTEGYSKVNVKTRPGWGNYLFGIHYFHNFNKQNFLESLLYSTTSFTKSNASATNIYFTPIKNEYIYINNNIKESGIKTTYNFNFLSQKSRIGLEYKLLVFSYDWNMNTYDLPINHANDLFFDFAADDFRYSKKSREINLFMNYNINISENIITELGYRVNYLLNFSKPLYSYHIDFNYLFNKNLNCDISFGKYFQYFYTIKEQRNEYAYTPLSIYFLSDNVNKISESYHFKIGSELRNLAQHLNIKIEPYFKLRDNLPSSDIKTKTYSFESGIAYGFDLFIEHNGKPFYSWIGYSFSKSVKNNNFYYYPSQYDRTHNFKILINYKINENWLLSAFWTYQTGLPYTPVIRKNEYIIGKETNDDVQYGKKNSARTSPTHRLDVSIKGEFIWNKIYYKVFLDVINVYNNPNPFFVSSYSSEIQEKRGSFIMPTFGISIEF